MESITRFWWLGLIVLFIVLRWLSGRMRQRHAAGHPAYELGAIAKSLGMSIMRGEASQNLALGPDESLALRFLGVQRFRTDVRLEGAKDGHSMTFVVRELGTRVRFNFLNVIDEYEFRADLAMDGVTIAAPFEAWTLSSNAFYTAVPSMSLPAAREGKGADVKWFVATDSHQLAATVAEWIQGVTAKPASYVHVTGSNGELRFVFTRTALATLIPRMAELQLTLWDLAKRLSDA